MMELEDFVLYEGHDVENPEEDYDDGPLEMSIEEFNSCLYFGLFNDYDGYGCFTVDGVEIESFAPSEYHHYDTSTYNGINWYNK